MEKNKNKLNGFKLYVEITKRNNNIFEIEHGNEPQPLKNSRISWNIYYIAEAIGENNAEVEEIFHAIQNGFIKSGVIQEVSSVPAD